MADELLKLQQLREQGVFTPSEFKRQKRHCCCDKFVSMKPPLFHPGQEVICTNDDFTLLLVQNPNIQTPKRGPIYTVRGVYDTHRGYGITLVEINNADVAPGFPEANFHESRFAPVPPLEEIDITEVVEESITV